MEIDLTITKDGLTVFVSPSFSETPESFTITLLDSVGDQVTQVTLPQLEYTVSESGVYKVVVEAIFGGSTYVQGAYILLEGSLLNQFIYTLVNQLIYDEIPLTYEEFFNYKQKWLEVLAPNFNPPIDPATPEENIPFLYKFLIAHLITRDIILKIAQQYLTASAYAFFSSSGVINTSGGIKKIVSGPIETEYFGSEETNSIQEVLKTAFIPGGMFENLVTTGCALASQLGIYLSHCPVPSDQLYVPKLLVLNDY